MGSDVFELSVNGRSVPVTAVPSLATSEYGVVAAEYAKMPSYCSIDPASRIGVHYAWISADGPVDATLTFPHPISNVTVCPPTAHNTVAGREAKLSASGPGYFVIEADGYPPFVLMIDPPEPDVPNREGSEVLDLATVMTDSMSVTDRTAAIEDALKKAANDKLIAFVPAGVYKVGPIRIHNLDHLQLYMAPGSLLRTEVSPAGENVHSHGLWIQDSNDLHLWGRGALDHQGFGNFAHGRNAYNHGLVSYFVSNDLCPWLTQSPLFMLRCQRVNIEGLLLRNARNMNANIRRCDNVTLRRVKLLTPPASTPEYADGFHFNSSVDVSVLDCLAFCNDDCFASGHYTYFDNRDSGTHVVDGLVGWNPRANGIRLGFSTYYNQGDYTFRNCHIGGIAYAGMLIHPLNDASEAHRYQRYGTVSLTDCTFDTTRATDTLVDVQGARMDALHFDSVSFTTAKPIRIAGHGDSDGIKSLRLRNVSVAGVPIDPTKSPGVEIKNATLAP